jgi:arylsulfatase A-like enzyme
MLMKAKHPWPVAVRRHTLALALMAGLINQASASDLNTAYAEQPSKRPNIVLILADDLGFTDSAPYGSEISTPALSELAENGIKFTNYHTAANCAPTRAMILSGVDNHRAGVANIPEMVPPELQDHPHYQGKLGNNIVTVATLLQDAGYHTYMAGKWHLGATPDLLPSSRGFERTVAMADSGADNWEQKPYLAIYEKANWFADGQRYTLPEDFYSSRFIVDKTIEFIDSNTADGAPFFAYIPFQAVHMPVQAPQEFIDRYMGVYDSGWTALREQRLKRAVALGIVPQSTATTIMNTTRDWEKLSADQKRYEAKRMAVYAAMVEAMDFHIARLVTHLKQSDQYDNTIFIFASDNGSEATGPANAQAVGLRFVLRQQGYNSDYDTLGLKGSFNSLSPSFASASASPLAYYKFHTGEGGMRVPLIIAGVPIATKQQISHAFSFVTDITPTILDLTGVNPPKAKQGKLRYGGREVEPMIGRSLLPLIKGEVQRIYGDSDADAVGYELAGHAALFLGDYKLVLNKPPVGDNQWHLYNIVSDPGETIDLRRDEPARLQRMLNLYHKYEQENDIQIMPAGFIGARQVAINGLRDRFGPQIIIGIITLLILTAFYAIYRRNPYE